MVKNALARIVRPVLRAVAVAGLCSAAACGGSSTTIRAPAMCPMKVTGAAATVIDTDDGVSIAFVAGTDDVAELRRRVHQIAADHASHHSMMGAGGVPATASAEYIADGARLVLVPDDPDQRAELQHHVRRHVERMSRGECRMMGTHAHRHGSAR